MCACWLDTSNDKGRDSNAGTQEFLGQNAGRYDRFMRKDRAAYDEKMYELIRPVVKAQDSAGAGYRNGTDRQTHRKSSGTHRGDGCLSGNDCRGQTGNYSAKAALFRAGYVPSAIREQIIRCGDRIKRTAYCAAAGKSTCERSTGC